MLVARRAGSVQAVSYLSTQALDNLCSFNRNVPEGSVEGGRVEQRPKERYADRETALMSLSSSSLGSR
jgi:hypothetical protein